MNLPNKITTGRIFLSVLLLIFLIFPFDQIGIEFPIYLISNSVKLNLKYIIGGIVFVIAAVTDFIDGKLARKNNMVTDYGKVMDAIADKILVNGVLIILAYYGFISIIIPVIIITRDTMVDSIKMVAGKNGKVVAASFMGKAKTMTMMIGVTLIFFANLPFELIGFRFADILLIIATILSVISGCQYFLVNNSHFV